MPLDMRQAHLADVAAWLGVTPVANEVLEAHKLAEVAKRPGSWWYHRPRLANFAFHFIGSMSLLGITVFGIMGVVGGVIGELRLSFGCLLGLGVSFYGVYRVTKSGAMSMRGASIPGPAKWHEYRVSLYSVDVPEPIRAIAAKILHETNDRLGMDVVYGRLVQNSITVDPYLVIRRDHGDTYDQIVIGIWDDSRIIHQATLGE